MAQHLICNLLLALVLLLLPLCRSTAQGTLCTQRCLAWPHPLMTPSHTPSQTGERQQAQLAAYRTQQQHAVAVMCSLHCIQVDANYPVYITLSGAALGLLTAHCTQAAAMLSNASSHCTTSPQLHMPAADFVCAASCAAAALATS